MTTDFKSDVKELLTELGANDTHVRCVYKSLNVADPETFDFVKFYVNNSHSPKHKKFRTKLVKLFTIDHPRDRNFKPDKDCKLLFHGSQKQNIYPILRDGFSHKKANENGNFFKGIYFSDCSSKAAIYTTNTLFKFCGAADNGLICPEFNKICYMFLSEVYVGQMIKYKESPGIKSARLILKGCDSVVGLGRWQPLSSIEIEVDENRRVEVPNGPLHKLNDDHYFRHDEYVVYKSNQIRHRYLLVVKFEEI